MLGLPRFSVFNAEKAKYSSRIVLTSQFMELCYFTFLFCLGFFFHSLLIVRYRNCSCLKDIYFCLE